MAAPGRGRAMISFLESLLLPSQLLAEQRWVPRAGLVCLGTSLPLPQIQGRAVKPTPALDSPAGDQLLRARLPVNETFPDPPWWGLGGTVYAQNDSLLLPLSSCTHLLFPFSLLKYFGGMAKFSPVV